jgi:hypothetical protein
VWCQVSLTKLDFSSNAIEKLQVELSYLEQLESLSGECFRLVQSLGLASLLDSVSVHTVEVCRMQSLTSALVVTHRYWPAEHLCRQIVGPITLNNCVCAARCA